MSDEVVLAVVAVAAWLYFSANDEHGDQREIEPMSVLDVLEIKRDEAVDFAVSSAESVGQSLGFEWNFSAENSASGENLNRVKTARSPKNLLPSAALVSMLKGVEGLSLTRYKDATGASIGYGHFFANFNDCPAQISREQAEAWFVEDIEARSAKWVRLYCKIDLEQYEFDALCSVAYNMSPTSFKKFAAEVNEGYNIDSIADESVSWVKPEYKKAIASRRAREKRLFSEGIYS